MTDTADRNPQKVLAGGGSLETLERPNGRFSAPGDIRVEYVKPQPHDLIYYLGRFAGSIIDVALRRSRAPH